MTDKEIDKETLIAQHAPTIEWMLQRFKENKIVTTKMRVVMCDNDFTDREVAKPMFLKDKAFDAPISLFAILKSLNKGR